MDHWYECSKKGSGPSSRSVLCILWIGSIIFALCLFLFGFFPMKAATGDFATQDDIPSKLYNISFDMDSLYERRVGRFIFILIDAFRWDFLENPEFMPYISKLRQSKHAAVLKARCHPPTATMPRVKALMTGSIPNYIDVVLNLGSDQVIEDNLIHQASTNGLKVVFYGDEVWLDIFPDKFLRKEGTTSFFVSDYTEVDLNVTRNIAVELKNNDWDILILHYLGLDHIGHLAGPSSPLVPPKLREMDSVIENLHQSLQHTDSEQQQQRPSYLVVVGDHGMHDSGSHGGATLGEILVSLILIDSETANFPFSGRPEVSQIDIAATIAVLLGLPIPKSSLGVLIPHALGRLNHEQYLFALFYNTQQVANQFLLADPNGCSKDSFIMFLEAQKAHLLWLQNRSEDLRTRTESFYFAATRGMSSCLVKNLVTFDIWALLISCLMLFLVSLCIVIANFQCRITYPNIGKTVFYAFLIGFIVSLLFVLLSRFCGTIIYSNEIYICILMFAVYLVFLHCWNLVTFLLSSQEIRMESFSLKSVFLRIGCALQAASLTASSLIEEEHQTWYFLWVTFMLLIFMSVSIFEKKPQHHHLYILLSILVGHRMLRKLNQTGDKWAFVPDIADWLGKTENHVYLSLIFLIGLFGVWISLYKLKCLTNTMDKVLYFLALVCVLLYRCSVGDISLPYSSGISRGVQEANLFWLLCVLICISSARRLKCCSFKEIIRISTALWVIFNALLLKPCNVVLIPYSVLASVTLQYVLKQPADRCIAHVWLGNVAFFYQGNSNSLSTIDVTAGYIGAEHQNMFSTGLFVFAHTYCFPVLATLLLWLEMACQSDSFQRRHNMITILQTSLIQRLLPLSVFCVVILIQRDHLFIWSVFAPKLLYEAVHSVVTFALVACGCIFVLC